jgi:hypothetical protein
MTAWVNTTDPQFMDAGGVGGMNAMFGTVSGAIAGAGSGVWAVPGLLSPEAMTVAFSGMVATIGLPRPWGLVASSGAVVRAHGILTGQDTTNYSVNFAPLVPASGSVTAYLAATIAQIQQNSFPIPGPPIGDPAYNPNFVPTIGYATNLYSVALSAVTGGIDNVNTFELAHTTLTAGQVTLASLSTVSAVRAAERKALPPLFLSAGGMLPPSQAQFMLSTTTSSLTNTLPSASSTAGLTFNFANLSTTSWTIVTSGSDQIFGINSTTGTNTISIPQLGNITLYSDGFNYQLTTFNAAFISPLGGVLTGTLPDPGMAAGAAVANIGFTPVQQGGGVGQGTNKIFLGFDGVTARITVDATDFGELGFLNSNQNWSGANLFNQTINCNGAINAGGAINATGNVVANSGYLRASLGSRNNPTDPNVATIQSDFIGGSNANGAFFSFPGQGGVGGGMQICRFSLGSVPANGTATWTFPSAFVSIPQVFASVIEPPTSTVFALWFSSVTTTEATLFNPNSATFNVDVMAIL